MHEPGIRPLRATLFVILSAGALGAGALAGVGVGHPVIGVAVGYVVYLFLAERAFRRHVPEANDVVRFRGGPRSLAAFALVPAALAAARVHAQAPLPFALHGFVDVSAAWNPNRPFDRNSFLPGTGTSAEKANELALNLAALDVARDAAPLGFHVVAVVGTGTDVVHAGERHPDAVRYVYQASVSYKVDVLKGLVLEAGIQPSHIGYEGFFSKDNVNYTRSWLGELSPYYQTGLKAALAVDDHVSAQLWLMNGWQNVEDGNDAKALGTQISWTDGRRTLTWNTFAGPELADDDAHWRTFSDLLVGIKPTERLQLAVSFDMGRQTRPGLRAARWEGVGLFARLAAGPKAALAARAELYHDRDGFMTGTAQTLWEGTLTLEARPHPQLVLKLEARYDRSTDDVFAGREGPNVRRDEPLVVLGAVGTF